MSADAMTETGKSRSTSREAWTAHSLSNAEDQYSEMSIGRVYDEGQRSLWTDRVHIEKGRNLDVAQD